MAGTPTSVVDPLLGREIMGTYKLVQVLGQGGMAVVYRGRHVLTDQTVAIKALPPDLASQTQVKQRFIDEARTLGRLEHPNIVHLHNFLEEDGHLYLVMQYAEGETFDEIIDREGRVSAADGVAIGCETLKALQYAHDKGVVHRDIKPSNIIIRGDSSVKVMDFGIAKIVGSTKLTVTGQTMGTVRFMAPEQVRGKNIDHRADLYSLGVTLYQALTGQTPFDGETHFDIMRKHLTDLPPAPSTLVQLPTELDGVLLRSLEKRADARFQTADEFRQALERVPVDVADRRLTRSVPLPSVGDEPAPAPPLATASMPVASAGGRKLSLQVTLAVVLLLAAGVTVLWVMLSEDDQGRRPRPGSAVAGTGTGSAVARRPPKWPPLHRVARTLKTSVDRRYPPDRLRVVSVRQRDADQLAAFYRRARKAYVAFLREEGIDLKVQIGALNLVLVPQAVLNSREHWSGVKPNVDYPTRYLAPASTLYVRDDASARDTDLPYGLALHFCARVAQLSNNRCLELAGAFEKYLAKRSKRLGPAAKVERSPKAAPKK
jgi:tRNA A-37 threonylcarbamoyl transferase component Bud32